ncbi:olfactory receptor 1020-like [Monodelphis domestica]|uniref:olfactory receptor 1020-like n=1 Tax=Monodelphis domestica TaxID=13616 RepID=UPI0024E20CE2|nr:olfactory receptor 1020-like [Monodelphis domestica]
MPHQNHTKVTEFILRGLTEDPELQKILFVVFLVIYIITLVGNLGLIMLIHNCPRLHTPMYFFLSHLSFVDLCYSSNITPQMLVHFLSERKAISYAGCFMQCLAFITLLITEFYILTSMAIDRYVAISSPLQYSTKMNQNVCLCLVMFPYVYGFLNGLSQTLLTFHLSFCGPNEINHFYCADPPLILLSCSDPYVKKMAMLIVRNQTEVTEFVLLGLSENPKLQLILFVIFLFIYTATMVGNLGMILLIKIEPRLHTPMYFFLSNLSFVDSSYSSSITPKMLVNLLDENKAISFNGCAAQFYFFGSFVGIECFLLAIMAYDRYVAICYPLLYSVIMSERICLMLVISAFLGGFSNAAIHTGMTFKLSFCGSNLINHFYCDTPPLLKLSCSDTYINGILIMIFSSLIVISCVLMILISYLFILVTILRMRSAEGRSKAFSTCASHLTAVTIYFGTILFMYSRPTSSYSMQQDKVVSVFYTVIIPMLNPFIYSLKNKDVKNALKKVLQRHIS